MLEYTRLFFSERKFMKKTMLYSSIFLVLLPSFIFSSLKKAEFDPFPSSLLSKISPPLPDLLPKIVKYLPSSEREKMSLLSRALSHILKPLRKKRIKKAFKNSLLYPYLNKFQRYTNDLSFLFKDEDNKKIFYSVFLTYAKEVCLTNEFIDFLNARCDEYSIKEETQTPEIKIRSITFNDHDKQYDNDLNRIDNIHQIVVKNKEVDTTIFPVLIEKTVADLSRYKNKNIRIIFGQEYDDSEQDEDNDQHCVFKTIKLFFEKINDYNNNNNIDLYSQIKLVDLSNFLFNSEICGLSEHAEHLDKCISILPLAKNINYLVPVLTFTYLLNKDKVGRFISCPEIPQTFEQDLPDFNFTEFALKELVLSRCALNIPYFFLDLKHRFTLFSSLIQSFSPFICFSCDKKNTLIELLLALIISDEVKDDKFKLKEELDNFFISTIVSHKYAAKYWRNQWGDSLLHLLLKNICHRSRTTYSDQITTRYIPVADHISKEIINHILDIDIDIHKANFARETPLGLLFSQLYSDEIFTMILSKFLEKMDTTDFEKILQTTQGDFYCANIIIDRLLRLNNCISLNLLKKIIEKYPDYFKRFNTFFHNSPLIYLFNNNGQKEDVIARLNFIQYILNEDVIENINERNPLNNFIGFFHPFKSPISYNDSDGIWTTCVNIIRLMLKKGADYSATIAVITNVTDSLDSHSLKSQPYMFLLEILHLLKKKILFQKRPW